MKIFILSLLVCTALAGHYGGYGGYGGLGHHGYRGLYQRVDSHYGNTAFSYNDGGSTRREHVRADGTIEGSYTVIDPNGNKRTVNYKAGPKGFEVDGDTGVDKATADAAAALAAQAPTAPPAPEVELPQAPEVPEAPEVELPVAPTNPPDYGKRNEEVYKIRKGAYGHGYYGHGGHYNHGGYYGGHGYGYSAHAPAYKVVKYEPKPAVSYGYGNSYAYGPYGHGYGYQTHAPAVKVVKYEPKPAVSYGYGNSYAYGPYGSGGYGGHGGYGNRGYGYGGLYQQVESRYGNTAFSYNDGGSTRREHVRADGTIEGSYTVIDPNGNKRTVNYKAGPNGFEVEGDTGVDKATADAAAALAALAPTAPPAEEVELPQAPEVPEVPEVELPVAPTNPPDYGKRNEEVYKIRKGAYGHGHHGYYGAGYGYHGRPYGYGYGLVNRAKSYGGHYW